MGEGQNGNGTPGRQCVHPASDTPPGSAPTLELEAVLGAALRGGRLDDEGESRAVAAFRSARDAGAHRARTRCRDNWRPRGRRWGARSVRATLSVVLASLTLGGVAFAAIGTGGGNTRGTGEAPGRPHPASTEAPTSTPHAPAHPDSRAVVAPSGRPATAKDTLAHCRSYEQVEPRDKALDSTAWQRLVTAAGGDANVRAYCAERLAGATAKTEAASKDKANLKGTAEPEAGSKAEPKANPTLSQGEPNTEPKAEPNTEPKAEPNTEPKAEPNTEPKAEPNTEPKAEPNTEPKAEPNTEPKAEPNAEPEADPKAEPNAQPKAEKK